MGIVRRDSCWRPLRHVATVVAVLGSLAACNAAYDEEWEDDERAEPAEVDEGAEDDDSIAIDGAQLSGAGAPLVARGADGRLAYGKYANRGSATASNRLPDFSFAGYEGGGVRLPDVPTVMTVSPPPAGADARAMLQAALDEVGRRAPDARGFRGALLLRAGRYDVSDSLRIPGGVVLRGSGQGTDGTVLLATARRQYNLVTATGAGTVSEIEGTRTSITSSFVPVGATSFNVASAAGLRPGDLVVVLRTPNATWLDELEMAPEWTTSAYAVRHERRVVSVVGNRVTVDVPIVDALESRYGGGALYKAVDRRVARVGIEDLRLDSVYASGTDEEHAWDAVKLTYVRDSWVRRITTLHFVHAAVWVSGSAFVTIQDAAYLDPISQIVGQRRYAFDVTGSIGILFQRLFARGGRHNFVTGAKATGPNVWLDAIAVDNFSDDGPHQRWSTGLLFDNINTSKLHVMNRKRPGSVHGWTGAQVLFYNTESSDVIADAPVGAMNYAIGAIGRRKSGYFAPEPVGIFQSHGEHVPVRSLYLAQLEDRLGLDAVRAIAMPRQLSSTMWSELRTWKGDGRLSRVSARRADPTCEGGIRSGAACCPASCGACGGSGCSKRPGGAEACCADRIVASRVSCSGASAPCVVDGDRLCATGTLSEDGKTCCSDACGSCGGAGCSSRPGGAAACCEARIVASGATCSGNVPPCRMD